MLKQYEAAKTDFGAAQPRFGSEVIETLSRTSFDEAEAEITAWEGYKPTPIFHLTGLADILGLKAVYYKHEGPRFGLGSFKALGGAYAVLRSIQRELSDAEGRKITVEEIRNGHFASQISEMTIISATDGNHGDLSPGVLNGLERNVESTSMQKSVHSALKPCRNWGRR